MVTKVIYIRITEFLIESFNNELSKNQTKTATTNVVEHGQNN